MFDHRKLQLIALQAFVPWVLFCGTTSAVVAAGQESMAIQADDVQWKPASPTLYGVEMAVLKGNPTQAGPFVMRLKFPAFFDYPVHRNPGTEEQVTVLSGAMGFAMGETFDRYVVKPLPAGSHFVVPDAWHFAWTFEETVVEVQGNGPWRVAFFEP